jgi:hypothetical protein
VLDALCLGHGHLHDVRVRVRVDHVRVVGHRRDDGVRHTHAERVAASEHEAQGVIRGGVELALENAQALRREVRDRLLLLRRRHQSTSLGRGRGFLRRRLGGCGRALLLLRRLRRRDGHELRQADLVAQQLQEQRRALEDRELVVGQHREAARRGLGLLLRHRRHVVIHAEGHDRYLAVGVFLVDAWDDNVVDQTQLGGEAVRRRGDEQLQHGPAVGPTLRSVHAHRPQLLRHADRGRLLERCLLGHSVEPALC